MQATTQNTRELRTGALTRRVRRREVAHFFPAFTAEFPGAVPVRRIGAGVGLAATLIGLLALSTGLAAEVRTGAPDKVGELIGMSVIGALLAIAAGFLLWWLVRTTARRTPPKRHFRLSAFAAENGLSYQPGPVPGTHITPWADRGALTVTRLFRRDDARAIEFANYELITGSAGSRNTQFGGYCAVRLATPLPHIVLQARGRRAPLRTGAFVPAGAQRLSLEGDFDRHFSLYCPEQYESDALYLFTPDFMARLIDGVHGFDVEIIDDWLFLVSNRDVTTLRPADWRGLYEAVGAISQKLDRWERWRDDRLPTGASRPSMPASTPAITVAPRGRRLRLVPSTAAKVWLLAGALFLAAVVAANIIK